MLERIRTFIGQNWLATIISIVAILYAVYEARRRRGPRLVYQFTGQRLIGTRFARLPSEVEIKFEGKSLTNLSQTQIVVWNKGDAPMRSTDVPTHDPLTFCFGPGARVFLAEVARTTREVNRAKVAYESGVSDRVIFSFEFLDRNDGALISVWHDSLDTMPYVSGTVLGQIEGPIGYGRFVNPRNLARPERTSPIESAMWFTVGMMRSELATTAVPLTMAVMGIVMWSIPLLYLAGILTRDRPTTLSTIFFLVAGAIYTAGGLLLFNASRRRFPKRLLPEEYRGADSNRTSHMNVD